MLVYGKYECFVKQMLYICVHPVVILTAAFCMTRACRCDSDVICVDHDLNRCSLLWLCLLCKMLNSLVKDATLGNASF